MSLLKTAEIRKMTPDERYKKFTELKKELMTERGMGAMGGAPKSPGKIRAIRTNIARMLTIMREEEIENERAEKRKKTPGTEKEKRQKKKKPAEEKARKTEPKGESAEAKAKEERPKSGAARSEKVEKVEEVEGKEA